MKKRRVTLQWAMVGVAALAVVVSIFSKKMLKRRHEFLSEAAYHQCKIVEETNNIYEIQIQQNQLTTHTSKTAWKKLQSASLLRLTYHENLKQQYNNASCKPWLSVGKLPKDPGEDLLWEAFSEMPGISSP